MMTLSLLINKLHHSNHHFSSVQQANMTEDIQTEYVKMTGRKKLTTLLQHYLVLNMPYYAAIMARPDSVVLDFFPFKFL